MPPESWIVLTVAGAFLLLGVAGSPLAWAALHLGRTRSDQQIDRRIEQLAGRVQSLEALIDQIKAVGQSPAVADEPARAEVSWGRRGLSRPHNGVVSASAEAGAKIEPALIAVPSLAAVPNERDAAISGLTQRYAAIWTLADTGASAEVIARATGQPIGQIELILGLRRQIDGNRNIIPHASVA
jgi:hypothetical protein